MKKKYNFTGDWISGFTQSDGSFVVSFLKQKKGVPIRPQPVFNITQSIVELEMFKALHNQLGIGKIYTNRKNVVFVVKSIDEIVDVILPLFDKHPVKGGKFSAYTIFKEVSIMIKEKKHLTIEGTLQILNLAYFMNKDTSLRNEESLKLLQKNLNLNINISNSNLINSVHTKNMLEPLTLEFVRGLIDGDGSFNISFATTRRRIVANFTVVMEISSISILNRLVDFFNCGAVYKLPSAAARYQVQSIDDILEKILPLFNNTKFNTKKQERFEIIIKVCRLIKNRGYANDEDLKSIVEIAWDMNTSRRKISKEEYLNKFIKTN